MAIRIFCTTLCTALATWAAVPALAFDLAATSPPAQSDAAGRQPAEIILLETNVFATPAVPAAAMAGHAPLAQFTHDGTAEIADRPGEQAPSAEQGNLPLLGAAAVALLVAQLRRSRRPMP